MDIFQTKWDNETGELIHPKNVGFPINSNYNDIFYVINKDSTEAFLASNRKGSYFVNEEHCCHDIYKVYFEKIEEELPKENLISKEDETLLIDSSQYITVLKGIVLDEKTWKRHSQL